MEIITREQDDKIDQNFQELWDIKQDIIGVVRFPEKRGEEKKKERGIVWNCLKQWALRKVWYKWNTTMCIVVCDVVELLPAKRSLPLSKSVHTHLLTSGLHRGTQQLCQESWQQILLEGSLCTRSVPSASTDYHTPSLLSLCKTSVPLSPKEASLLMPRINIFVVTSEPFISKVQLAPKKTHIRHWVGNNSQDPAGKLQIHVPEHLAASLLVWHSGSALSAVFHHHVSNYVLT